FMGAAFGVSPDPEQGEIFEPAFLDIAYEDVIHIKVPTSAADVDPTLPAAAPIDSLSLLSVTLVDLETSTEYTMDEIGLDITCNNNGDSDDPCTFLGGNQYCALISGTPTQTGQFQLIITVLGYTTVFGTPISQEVEFDQYEFVVYNDIADNLNEAVAPTFSLSQNIPNPVNGSTVINYELPQAGDVTFRVINLLGETVFEKTEAGKRGASQIKIPANSLEAGIYLYSIESSNKVLTKRMVVNR
ncbi:MAG: T9SS type A sorting domain-containing protein, partial [Flavobacteriales bacterium]